jgi:hypothetical protein
MRMNLFVSDVFISNKVIVWKIKEARFLPNSSGAWLNHEVLENVPELHTRE